MNSTSELLNHELEEKMATEDFAESPPSINAQGSYEFSHTENAIIHDLVGKMRFVGMFLILVGLLACVTVVQGHYAGLVSGLINIVIGIYTRSAAERFARIFKTEGDDIRHLMDALGQMLKIYRLQMVLILIAIVLMVVAWHLFSCKRCEKMALIGVEDSIPTITERTNHHEKPALGQTDLIIADPILDSIWCQY